METVWEKRLSCLSFSELNSLFEDDGGDSAGEEAVPSPARLHSCLHEQETDQGLSLPFQVNLKIY